jgi:S1-C subfamily serine protease
LNEVGISLAQSCARCLGTLVRALCAGLLVSLAAHAQSSASASAVTPAEIIARSKPSVVLVGTFNPLATPRFSFRGTGFAVADGTRIVTNAHVLPEPGSEQASQLAVQVKQASGAWELRKVLDLSLERAQDLAVLEIGAPALRPLPLKTDLPEEGTEVLFIGFPIGGALGFSHVSHRGMVSAVTPVALPAPSSTTLNARNVSQLRAGSFNILQLDATAYPGNSGGPVLDARSGEVLGVINMVLIKNTKESVLAQPSGISYAIPIENVARILQR